MKYLRCAAAGGAVAIAAAGLTARSHADSIPPGWEANNMEPIGYSALDNRKGAFKMAIKKVRDCNCARANRQEHKHRR